MAWHRILAAVVVGTILVGAPSRSPAQSTGPGNVQNVSSSPGATAGGGTIVPDLFTGTATFSIPIEVPPGRHGMAPRLALTYNSGGGRGTVGWGWDLPVDGIERQTKNGLSFSVDDYVLRVGGVSVDLMNISGNEYGAKIEAAFLRVRKLTQTDGRPYWEVTDKLGNKSLFGQTAVSRQDDPTDSSKIFRWAVDQVRDTNGNTMTFTYSKYFGELSLWVVDYSGYRVDLYYDLTY